MIVASSVANGDGLMALPLGPSRLDDQ
eukprot:SAG31_NODE_21954_length_537_cov_0.883562_2_plen_26_part_01